VTHYAIVVVPEANRDLLLSLTDPLNTPLPEYACIHQTEGPDDTLYLVENLDPDTRYCVRIWPYDSFGVGIPTQIRSFQPESRPE